MMKKNNQQYPITIKQKNAMEAKNFEIISPLMENAFTEPVLHKVVLSKIDFELPDEIWDAINDGFAYYWDFEVGFGNYADFEDTCRSINKHLESANIIYPYDKLEFIVNTIYDFVEQIPDAFLDESAAVIPVK